jgi:hypothetical protein
MIVFIYSFIHLFILWVIKFIKKYIRFGVTKIIITEKAVLIVSIVTIFEVNKEYVCGLMNYEWWLNWC